MPVVRRSGPVVVRRPVVVRPPVGATIARAVVVGATVGLMASAMGRRGRSQHQVHGSTIVVVQPFPGTLIAVHEEHNSIAFVTIPVTEAVPEGAHLVYRPGQSGTSVQIPQGHGDFVYKVIPPGHQFPHGAKSIRVELAPGTLVQITQPDGQVVQQVIPAPQPIPEGSIVLQRPDGKPPPGTLVQFTHNGKTIQQIIYPGQTVPPGAVIINTGPTPPAAHASGHHQHGAPAVDAHGQPVGHQAPPPQALYAPPGAEGSLYATDSNGEARSVDMGMPPPPGDVNLYGQPSDPQPAGLYSFADPNQVPPPPTGVNLEKDAGMPPPDPRGSMYQPPSGPATYVPQQAYVPAQPMYVPPGQPAYAPAPPAQPAYAPAQPVYAPAPAQPAYASAAPVKPAAPQVQQRASNGPPAWVPDEQAPSCMKCRSPFTLTTRRHHCRNCGKIFCKACAHSPLVLSQYNFREPVRVCNDCYTQITNTQPPPAAGGCSIM